MLLLGAAIVLLLLVFVPGIGVRINGARRWLHLVITSFQPVEAVKLILVVYTASYLVRHRESVRDLVLGLVQADRGRGTVRGAVAAAAGFRFSDADDRGDHRHDLARRRASRSISAAWACRWWRLLWFVAKFEPYRVRRLTSFIDPWADPFNDGFQLTQSLMAIGRGEWIGVGLGSSVLKLSYLPEAHTDFIFAVISEELGLAGILLVMAPVCAGGRARPVHGPQGSRAGPALLRLRRVRHLVDAGCCRRWCRSA